MEDQKCVVCETTLSFRWTDTHGVGVCGNCGCPYTILHYDENKQRVDKAPECALSEPGVATAKRYWGEKHRMVFPGVYDMGILPGRGTTYSGASMQDVNEFDEWYLQQPEYAAYLEEKKKQEGES